MGFDTDEGCYTYHYELNDWDLFQCKELDKGKPWDGHTSSDVRRLLSIPAAVPVSELLSLRDNLYEDDLITMRGLRDLNMLIAKYEGGKDHALD